MKRSAPLKRRKPMRKAVPRRITRPGPGRDEAYLEKVRDMLCRCWLELDNCVGDVVAHHAGPKTNDSTAVPLCWKHHAAWHEGNGVFKSWSKAQRREWAENAIAETQAVLTPS